MRYSCARFLSFGPLVVSHILDFFGPLWQHTYNVTDVFVTFSTLMRDADCSYPMLQNNTVSLEPKFARFRRILTCSPVDTFNTMHLPVNIRTFLFSYSLCPKSSSSQDFVASLPVHLYNPMHFTRFRQLGCGNGLKDQTQLRPILLVLDFTSL